MDSSQPISGHTDCPDCGTPIWGDETSCWLCGWKRGQPISVQRKQVGPSKENPYASPVSPNQANLNWTFSVSTLFLWTALVAVVMGVVRIAPGLGIALGIFSFPAALHTIGVVGRRKRASGHALSVAEKIMAFLASFGWVIVITAMISIAAFGGLFVICIASGTGYVSSNGDPVVTMVTTAVGVIFVGFVAYHVVRALRPRTKD